MYLYDYESAFEMWQRNNNIFDKKKKEVDLKTVQTNSARMQHLHFVKYCPLK